MAVAELIEKKFSNISSIPEPTAKSRHQAPKEPLEKAAVYFCYGFSVATFLLLQKQLDAKNVRLIFVEDAVEELKLFAQEPLAETILKHPSVEWHFAQEKLALYEMYKILFWRHIADKTALISVKKPSPKEDRIRHLKEGVHFTFSDYSDFGEKVVKNVLKNLQQLTHVRNLADFKNAFPKIPAWIIGAGPSLDQDADLLKKYPGLLFAGGSSLAVLQKKQMTPHFAASID